MSNMYGIGKLDKGVTVKTMHQHGAGTAWKKITFDCVTLWKQGYTTLIIKINRDHYAKTQLLKAVRDVRPLVPTLTIEVVVET